MRRGLNVPDRGMSLDKQRVAKVDVRPEWWDNIFAPSSCLVVITTVDEHGAVNAASFGTCTRVCHDPVYISFTAGQSEGHRAQRHCDR